jgi:hypothetical protein
LSNSTDAREKVLLRALDSALSGRASAEQLVGDRLSRLAALERLAEERARVIADMQKSLSWRITAPLRWGKRGWRRIWTRWTAGEAPPSWPPTDSGWALPATTRDDGPLSGRPWRHEEGAPAEALDVPSMITDDERRLLYWLARNYFRGEGRILDAGCYLGGSTLALATGLRDRGYRSEEPPIVSYDLFQVDDDMHPDLSARAGLEVGDSFRPLFEENLGDCRGFCTVVEGDIREHGWVAESPIEIAFIDILKTWELNDFVVQRLFSELIPGLSILIQQDFVHESCPWVHVTMEHFRPYFELLDVFDFGSAVYLLREPIPSRELEISIAEDLSPERKLALMDSAIEPFSGEMRGILECAKASLLYHLVGSEAFDVHLAYVASRYGRSHQVSLSVDSTKAVFGVGSADRRDPLSFHVPDPG